MRPAHHLNIANPAIRMLNFEQREPIMPSWRGEHKFSRSTRLRGSDIEDAITQFELKTIVGDSGHLTLANTSGYHRKGQHLSSKPRVTLTFQIPRKNIISKLLINLSKAALPNI